jgi:hypothetical protein
MATGTPVVAFRAGSVPEVIGGRRYRLVWDSFSDGEHGASGRLTGSPCMQDHVERRFSAEAMAEGYKRA